MGIGKFFSYLSFVLRLFLDFILTIYFTICNQWDNQHGWWWEFKLVYKMKRLMYLDHSLLLSYDEKHCKISNSRDWWGCGFSFRATLSVYHPILTKIVISWSLTTVSCQQRIRKQRHFEYSERGYHRKPYRLR